MLQEQVEKRPREENWERIQLALGRAVVDAATFRNLNHSLQDSFANIGGVFYRVHSLPPDKGTPGELQEFALARITPPESLLTTFKLRTRTDPNPRTIRVGLTNEGEVALVTTVWEHRQREDDIVLWSVRLQNRQVSRLTQITRGRHPFIEQLNTPFQLFQIDVGRQGNQIMEVILTLGFENLELPRASFLYSPKQPSDLTTYEKASEDKVVDRPTLTQVTEAIERAVANEKTITFNPRLMTLLVIPGAHPSRF